MMVPSSPIEVGAVGYGAAAAMYLILALLVAARNRRSLPAVTLAAASVASMAWAAATAFDLSAGQSIGRLAEGLEIVRSAAWIVLVLTLLHWISPGARSSWTAGIIGLCIGVVGLTLTLGDVTGPDDRPGQLAAFVGHLALALLGLALVENLLRNSPQSSSWSVKYLCLGIGAIFAYDFFLYSDALLLRRVDMNLVLARGLTSLLVAPLLAIYAQRAGAAGPQIAVSRRFVLHSATLVGAGLYLIAMAAAGYYVRQVGGAWSTFLQAIFFFAAILVLLVSVWSSTFRANLRVLIEKSLFKYRYDYREEWVRFIRTTSAAPDGLDLRERVIQAVCDIVESPEGALWVAREPGRFILAGAWNVSRWSIDGRAAIDADSALVLFLMQSRWIVSLDEYAVAPERYQGLTSLPAWLRAISRAWLIVPLFHHERLYGILIVGDSRAKRALSWEDFDILKTVGSQAASILAQQDTDTALAEARQFEAFNKRFAFVAHDIKNLASQLSLLLSNAARHAGNVEFQNDVIRTVRQSVDKLNRMLRQLHGGPGHAEAETAVDLASLLRDVVERWVKLDRPVFLDLQLRSAAVRANEERLKAVIDHLVQNALDAVGKAGRVDVRLREAGEMAAAEIVDNGPGMDSKFLSNRLFRPFDTTKRSGYGIGVYESRDYANALGGRLEVASEPGQGTIMRICLPRLAAARTSSPQPAENEKREA